MNWVMDDTFTTFEAVILGRIFATDLSFPAMTTYSVKCLSYKRLYSFLYIVFVCLVLAHFVTFIGHARNPTGSALNINYKLLAFSENLLYAPLFLVFLVKHTILTLSNTTSIEVLLKKEGVMWEYDLGRRKNFEQVFGTTKLLWFLPLYAKEDLESIPALQGLDFPVRLDVET